MSRWLVFSSLLSFLLLALHPLSVLPSSLCASCAEKFHLVEGEGEGKCLQPIDSSSSSISSSDDHNSWSICPSPESSFENNAKNLSLHDKYFQVHVDNIATERGEAILSVVPQAQAVVYVKAGIADSVGNVSACNPANTGGDCNLRSAIAFCQNIFQAPNQDCTIMLPHYENIFMDPDIGDIFLSVNSGTLTIEGNGCWIQPLVQQNFSTVGRLFNVRSDEQFFVFTFKLNNATIRNFGGITTDGGAINAFRTNIKMASVLFDGNTGDKGGAFRCYLCEGLELFSVSFFNNSASSLGGGAYVSFTTDVNFTHCDFIGNSAGDRRSPGNHKGGGLCIDVENRNILLQHCTFADNRSKQGGALIISLTNIQVKLLGCSFSQNFGSLSTGGIEFSSFNEKIYIENCQFENNAGLNAGVVFFDDGNTDIEIVDSVFDDNEASSDSGALTFQRGNSAINVKKCVFRNNKSSVGGNGGAVRFGNQNSDIRVSDSVFESNVLASGSGAAVIFSFENDGVLIANCEFIKNKALRGSGGALSLDRDNNDVLISQCQFVDNAAREGGSGGGIYLHTQNTLVVIEESQFRENSANRDGGAIAINSNNEVDIRYSFFSRNVAQSGSGGAILVYSQNANILAESLKFVRNSAGQDGGAMAFVSGNVDALIQNCNFTFNIATDSGGALHSSLANLRLVIRNSYFFENQATFLYGGGLYFGEDHETIELNDVILSGNRAVNGGGVFFFWFNEHVRIVSCVINKNVALQSGGALVSLADELEVVHSVISESIARDGHGGVSVDLARSVLIHNTTIAYNSASSKSSDDHVDLEFAVGSGGLYITGSERIAISNCLFANNFASQLGGGLHILYSVDIVVRDSTFQNNSALYGGGAYVFSCSDAVFQAVDFMNNSALNGGGGVYVTSSEGVIIANSTLSNNLALAESGSAIWAVQSQSINISGNIFGGNAAFLGGGTVAWKYDGGKMSEPKGLKEKNMFHDESNYALYGLRWATEAISVNVFHSEDNSSVVDVLNYDQHLPPISMALYDYYDQIVAAESSGYGQLFVPSDMSHNCKETGFGYIGGGTVRQFSGGVTVFEDVDAFCAPGGLMYLNASSDLVSTTAAIKLSFRKCIVGEYIADRICSACPNGTYSFQDPHHNEEYQSVSQSELCKPCPYGAEKCYRNTIEASRGYWRINANAETLLRCPWEEDSCEGSVHTGDSSCSSNNEGPLCAVCKSGYFFEASGSSCRACQDTAAWFDAFTITVLIVLAVVVVFGLYYLDRLLREQRLGSFNDFFISIVLKLRLVNPLVCENAPLAVDENIIVFKQRLRTLGKIYITFFQILSSIPSVLGFDDFPLVYKRYIADMDAIVNIGISRSAIFSCLSGGNFDFIDRLLLDTMYPMGVLVLFFAVYKCHVWFRFGLFSQQTQTALDVHLNIASLRSKYVGVFLFFTYLILPSLTATIFETFPCQNVDPDGVEGGDNRYLRADYSISCHSSRYKFARVWAVLMIFVYVLGLPGFYAYLLYFNRDEIRSRDVSACKRSTANSSGKESQHRLSAIGILFESYKPQLWYWELVETSYRLSLTGFLVLGRYAGDNGQMLLGLTIALSFKTLYQIYDPLLDSVCQLSKVATLVEVCLVFSMIILIKVEFLSEAALGALTLVLVCLILLGFVLSLGFILRQFLLDTSLENMEQLTSRDQFIIQCTQTDDYKKETVVSTTSSPFVSMEVGPGTPEETKRASNLHIESF